jgi:hypothetical protein
VMTAVLANLKTVLEFAFEEMSFTTVAFYKDIFRLYDALFWRNCFNSLCLFVEPGHLEGLKVSTKPWISELRIYCFN